MVLDQIEELLPEALADFEFRPRKHFLVFREDGGGNVQPGGLGDRKKEDSTLEPVRFQGSRDDDVGINDEPKRDHPRFGFCARVALTTWSICRDVILSVPLRCDSSPSARSTSGSGAARRT